MTDIGSNKSFGFNFDNSYSRLPEVFFSKVEPTPVKSPALIIFNQSLATSLGIDLASMQSDDGVGVLAGNNLPDGATPIAQAYAGHQFGHFTKLGDGRAILLGEQLTPNKERYDIQLKGPGRTPYSRGGDGRAAVGPMLREYIISEAMHALGIPTTRSLAVVSTGELVYRETALPGAILTRVASSHIRVGTYEYAVRWGSTVELKALADYTIQRHYPDAEGDNRYLTLLKEVINRQASLIAKWQIVGFIHGVMNTDNMTISGETIDYGPCAFMDTYDPATVFSSIDREGRYAYANQPYIGGWNLTRFAETLIPLLHENQESAIEMAEEVLSSYSELFQKYWLDGMRSKLGLFNKEEQDELLIKDLLGLMHKYRADFTNTFMALSLDEHENTEIFNSTEFTLWKKQWNERLGRQKEARDSSLQLMRKHNPVVIPRNHRVEEALEAAVRGDYSVMEQLLQVLSNPYEYNAPEKVEYCSMPGPTDKPYRTFCGT